ncbi:MAG: hybrid sensor histidine kinase/response regulator [Chromatiaceae bacterium]|nr:hybrid sensor histidine kinase/response regulator [Candidatus Thioaporhodococcus sediminis]
MTLAGGEGGEAARVSGRGRLRARIVGVALLPMLLATSILAGYVALRDIRQADADLDSLGQDMARHLAESASLDMPLGNIVYLKRMLDYEGERHRSDSIGILDARGQWWLVSGHPHLLPAFELGERPRMWRQGSLRYYSHPVDTRRAVEEANWQGQRSGLFGQVVVVLNDGRIASVRQEILTVTLALLAGLLVLVGLLGWWLSRSITRPLDGVLAAVDKLSHGRLETRLPARSPGEVGDLERGINQMAEALEDNQRQMAQRVETATAELSAQKQAAEAAVLAKSKFLATASHDLRQPLHAMSLLVSALKEKIRPDNSEARHLVQHIEASAYSMENMLSTLLDLSRLDAGVVVARPVCLPVEPILARLRQQFQPVAAEKGLELRIPTSRLGIFTDPALLERILANLIANAIRYTERGKVLLVLRRIQKDWVRIEVHDTGRGIPEHFRERIFEEYFQLENPERDRGKGLGLGLAIVKRLSQLLGSPVQVQSGPKGTCFSLRAARCQIRPGRQAHATPPALAVLPEQALVAFIEDDETILEAMAALFEQWGIELAAGGDVAEAKADLLELGRAPDVILSDYRLRGGRNGIEAINELRAVFGPQIPAALITGDTAPSTIQAISASGLPMLHKPVKPAKLRALLTHLLSGGGPEG